MKPIDQDSLSKRKYYYTAPSAGKKLVIPEHFKNVFAAKQITCGMSPLLLSALVESRIMSSS